MVLVGRYMGVCIVRTLEILSRFSLWTSMLLIVILVTSQNLVQCMVKNWDSDNQNLTHTKSFFEPC